MSNEALIVIVNDKKVKKDLNLKLSNLFSKDLNLVKVKTEMGLNK